MSGDLTLSTGEIAIITALLGAVVGALVTMFKLLLAERDARLADLRDELERGRQERDALLENARYSVAALEKTTHVAEDAVTVVRGARR